MSVSLYSFLGAVWHHVVKSPGFIHFQCLDSFFNFCDFLTILYNYQSNYELLNHEH